jgi:hypothetical protein
MVELKFSRKEKELLEIIREINTEHGRPFFDDKDGDLVYSHKEYLQKALKRLQYSKLIKANSYGFRVGYVIPGGTGETIIQVESNAPTTVAHHN